MQPPHLSPPSPFPFQCLILQIDIIRCIIRPLIHHGNGLGRSVAQMCFSPPLPPHHHRWLSPKPQSPSSPSPPPSFAPPRVWQRQRGWGVGVEQREEEGDVIEGWNHTIPQGAPTSPSPSSPRLNPGDPLGRRGL